VSPGEGTGPSGLTAVEPWSVSRAGAGTAIPEGFRRFSDLPGPADTVVGVGPLAYEGGRHRGATC